MAKTLKIVLALKDQKTSTFSLADPKDGLTKAAVTAATDEMIAKNFVLAGGSGATGVKDAYISNVERIELA
ncbi:MAG: DUF2922 domain-containing protein [Veillonellaceae bacterium]|nr:DUF2922 domain-containing protein [Veillonellaceae bacterium]